MSEWDDFIPLVEKLIDAKENYSRRMGEIALTIKQMYGPKALVSFSEELYKKTGRKIPAETLRN